MENKNKYELIFTAALELIAEKGFHGVPMSLITHRAGVGAGTIYRYFKNKDELIMALHRDLEETISNFLRDGYILEAPLKERFVYLVRKVIRYFIEHPLHFRYMEQYFNSPYGVSLRRERLMGRIGNHNILMDIFIEGIQQRTLKDLPKTVLFSMTFGPITLLLRDHTLGLVNLDERLIEQATEACWDGIKR